MAPTRKSYGNRGEEIENMIPGPKGQRLVGRKMVETGQDSQIWGIWQI